EVSEPVERRAAASESIAIQADTIDVAMHNPETATLRASQHAASVALTTTPLLREIRSPDHRLGSLGIRANARLRGVLYAIPAGTAAIISLLLVADWRPHDERSVAPTNSAAEQPAMITTEQPIAVSVYVDPQFAEEGSATSGQSPPQTIGAAELAELL